MGYVECIGQGFWWENLKESKHLEDRHRWDSNIKKCLKRNRMGWL